MTGERKQQEMLSELRQVFRAGDYLVSRHFLTRLRERGIKLIDVADAIREDAPEVIEDYPDDARGASCLILCEAVDGTRYHVQCGYPPDAWLITVYVPDPRLWSRDLRRRRRK